MFCILDTIPSETKLNYINIDFHWVLDSRRYWIFSKGLTHDLGQKFEISRSPILPIAK